MKRIVLLSILLFSFLLSGCASGKTQEEVVEPAGTCAPSVEVNPAPVLYGMWMNEQNETLVFSENSLYMVQLDETSGEPQLRETFFEIQSVDWAKDVVTLHMSWVRVSGQYGGFDMPLHYMKISIDGTTLFYSMGDEGQGIPASAETGPFNKK
jgi:hypothetical protein